MSDPRIPFRDEWADGRDSRYHLLDPDPLPVPDPAQPSMPPRAKGCIWLVTVWIVVVGACLAFWAAMYLVLAAGQPVSAPSEAQSPAVSSPAGTGLRGAPRSDGVTTTALGAPSSPALMAVPIAEPYPSPAPSPLNSGEVSTAPYSASATWCAPTLTQCQSWGGDARLAAVNSFRWGDAPWWVRVTRGSASVLVLVVSHCQCQGRDDRIDLSPDAFSALADLSLGRVQVSVEVLAEHPDDARMRDEVRGDELYSSPSDAVQ